VTQDADVGSDDRTLGLMMEFERSGHRYAYLSPLDITAIEEGGSVGGKPTSRLMVMRAGATYSVDVLGKARHVAERVHEGRKAAADSFAYALLSDEGKSTLETRLRDAIVKKVEQTLTDRVKDETERILPKAVALELVRLETGPVQDPVQDPAPEPEPPTETPKDVPDKRRKRRD